MRASAMKKISIVGMGPGNPEFLTSAARQALVEADVVIGAERLLAQLPPCDKTQSVHAAVRTDDIIAVIGSAEKDSRVCIAMSGDTGIFSGTKALVSQLGEAKVEVIPGVGSVQYFSAKLNRPWQSWRCISAHGVACDPVAELRHQKELFMVTGGSNSVRSLCETLDEAGFSDAQVSVGERLSYEDEKITTGTVSECAHRDFHELSVMLVTRDEGSGTWPWSQAGIPDELFLRGRAPMTKQEVRAVILSKLKVSQEDIIYDIGAGTGSVSVELALAAYRGHVYAIERNDESVELIVQNVKKFALANVTPIKGSALDVLSDIEVPDAVFIGGSGGDLAEIVAAVYAKNANVRICVACVTLDTLKAATDVLAASEFVAFEVCQLAVTRTEPLAGYSFFKAQNPIFLVSAQGGGKA